MLERNAVLGHYRIIEPIGNGAFSTVYRGRDDRLDADVAVKVLAENHALNPDMRARFIDEARLTRKVNSSAIVQVFDVGETNTLQPFLVMELADRADLHTRVLERAPGGVTPSDVKPVLDLLDRALAELHAVGLIHRDIKPSNIVIASGPRRPPPLATWLGDDERLLLTDLGFAKDLGLASGYTSGGGTQWFRAPEQSHAVSRVDHRADLYSASAVVAWLLTGGVPLEGASWYERVGQAGLQPKLASAVLAGLAPEPDQRPVSAGTWRRNIEAAVDILPGAGTVVTSRDGAADARASSRGMANGGSSAAAPPGTSAGGQPTRRRARFLVAVAAALVFGGGAGVVLADRIDPIFADGRTPVVTESVQGERIVVEMETPHGVLAIAGPRIVVVGRPAQFTATGPDGADLFWVGLAGGRQPAAQPLDLVANTSGPVPVNLAGVISGRAYALTHEFGAIDD